MPSDNHEELPVVEADVFEPMGYDPFNHTDDGLSFELGPETIAGKEKENAVAGVRTGSLLERFYNECASTFWK
ncbi:MAG: hypothetical protein FJ267_03040 [Planctomycetes bacterium]|nr:hypothetical protein [Planctomycetota bacterium]